jgi:hypothetical protein
LSKLIDLNLRPDETTLRQFGWIALAGFGFLAAIAWWELFIFAFGLGEARAWVAGFFAALAVLAAFFSLVFPKANLPIYVGLSLVAYPIGLVLANVILGALFYGLITPVGLFFRLVGRDSLKRKFEPEARTYWEQSRKGRSLESYFKQF